jgi:hypothetical protein
VADCASSRIADPKPCEERALPGLRGLDFESGVPVEDIGTDLVEVREVVQGVEDRVGVAASPRRRAHPVDEERVPARLLARIEDVTCGVDTLIGNAPAIELREERLEPERMLVENSDRVLGNRQRRPSRGARVSSGERLAGAPYSRCPRGSRRCAGGRGSRRAPRALRSRLRAGDDEEGDRCVVAGDPRDDERVEQLVVAEDRGERIRPS